MHITREKETEILEAFRKDYAYSMEKEADIRRTFLKDKKFTWSQDQWEDEEKIPYQQYVTINRLQGIVRKIVNDSLKNKASIRVRPRNKATDVETAEKVQGLCRSIEENSHASLAYQAAYSDAVSGGRGFFRIITKYVSEKSFDQEVKIVPIYNALSVAMDPDSRAPDGSDARFAVIHEYVTKEEFEIMAPGKEPLREPRERSSEDTDKVLYAEYFRVVDTPETLYLFRGPNGETFSLYASEAKKKKYSLEYAEDSRTSFRRVVEWYKIGGDCVLEATTFPGPYIPIVPVIGREINTNGKRELFGLSHYARHSQKMYNYARTRNRDQLEAASLTTTIGPEGTFEGHEAKWSRAHRQKFPYLEYKPITLNGAFAPAPTRLPPISVDPAISQEIRTTDEEMKALTGIYDSDLGKGSFEQSGRAVLALQNQSQIGTYDFVENLHTSVRHGARIIASVIPEVYDTRREIEILGEDDKKQVVSINDSEYIDPKTGEPKIYDFSKLDLAVELDVGPSFATKRIEAAESIMAFLQTPGGAQFGEITGDLLAENMDWPGASQLAKRMRKLIQKRSPGIIEETEEEKSSMPSQEEMNGKIQELQDQLKSASEYIQKLEMDKKAKEVDSQAKIDIAEMDNATKIHLAHINNGTPNSMQDIAQELLYLRSLLEQKGKSEDVDLQPIEDQQPQAPEPNQQLGGPEQEQSIAPN